MVALAAVAFSAQISAQSQPTHSEGLQLLQPTQPQAMEASTLNLPEAPRARDSSFAGSPFQGHTVDPVTIAQTSSSSSQPDAPAKGPVPPAAVAPAAKPGPETKQEEREKSEEQLKQEEQQRLLGVVPNFNVVLNGNALPLTGAEKWNLAFHGIVDPFYFGWAFVIGGGFSELIDSNSGYGWGPPGYFKRVGATYADDVNGAIIGNALLPQLLHQDPRYFRKGTGSIKSRIWVAALSTVECRGDNGKKQFNTSNVLGNYISGAISNAYYPANQRGVGLTLENGTEVTLFGALGGQMYEFAPDLIRIVFHRHSAPPTPPGAGRITP
jgi:hypothetical protein